MLLKDCIEIKNGKDYSDLSKGDIPVYGTGGVFKYVNHYLYDGSALLLPRKGSLNNVMYIEQGKFWTVDTMFYAICKNNETNLKYIYYYLTLFNIAKLDVGSTIPSMTTSLYYQIDIPLPNIQTQNKIVEVLSNIDSQINRNNHISKSLQVLGHTIYSKNAKMQISTFNIENVCKPIWGNCPAGEYILNQYSSNIIPYASGAGDIDNNISVNPKAFTNKPTRIVHKNDICISVAGTIGKIAIATEDICIGRAMLGFSHPELYGYIYFGLNSYASALQKKATGAIQKIINSEHLSIVNLPMYTDDVVKNLNLIIDEVLRIEEHTKQLNQLKEKLLPLLINGQLSV